MSEKFLVTSRADMELRGWDQLDFVYINGDAYVDHPGFAAALIGRVLESRGYRVGIISQPDWHSAEPFKALGKPRLAALITAGNLDSMLSEKTAAKKYATMIAIHLVEKQGTVLNGRPSCMPIACERLIMMCPSSSVVSKRASGGLPTMIIGLIKSAILSSSTARRIY